MKIKPCPCGAIPKALFVQSQDKGDKYAYVSAIGCCDSWEIEFRNNYKIGDESHALAVESWNSAPRIKVE